jgi:hypothetical protein
MSPQDPLQHYIQLLQTALVLEYEDIFLYLRESALFKSKLINGEDLGALFHRFCDSEMWHADRPAAELIRRGEKPAWDFKTPPPTDSVRGSLSLHETREAHGLNIYQRILDLKVADITFQRTLLSIYGEEHAHYKYLTSLSDSLRRVRKRTT